MHGEILDSINHLADHRRVLEALFRTFKDTPRVVGLFVSGSTARRSMDRYSDIDLGVVLDSDGAREKTWKDRWDWQVEPWFHRFDADHIKAHFVIYLFDPCVKADINLYTLSDLPAWQGAPYDPVMSHTEAIEDWCKRSNAEASEVAARQPVISNDDLIHDDERVWAWLVYVTQHVLRGEYYSAAASYPDIRYIIERWSAILRSESSFDVRKIESRYPAAEVNVLSQLFPAPDPHSLRISFDQTIVAHERQRLEITKRFGVDWRTSDHAITRVKEIVQSIGQIVD
jgi:predicted nucleotidyltransferase